MPEKQKSLSHNNYYCMTFRLKKLKKNEVVITDLPHMQTRYMNDEIYSMKSIGY